MKYEIHLTVDPYEIDRCSFMSFCKAHNVKPLFIQNYKQGFIYPWQEDILTSSVIDTDYYGDAIKCMSDLAIELANFGFIVIRRKIEVDHTDFPSGWPSQYVESHLKLRSWEAGEEIKLPMSWSGKIIGTKRCRTYDELHQFFLDQFGLVPAKAEIEYCLIDDNEDHDMEWLESYANL